MMYFIVKNDLVRIIILIEYILYICIKNITNTLHFTVNITEQHSLVTYFDILYVML